ncbi:MAG: 6-phosphogluconolactonase [Thermoleophilia bacterium]
MSGPEIVIVPDMASLADEAAERVERVALKTVPGEKARIALAGGSTPRWTYQHLAARCPPWGRIEVWFGDERCVPPDDEGSNYRMAKGALLDRVPLMPTQVHRILGELPPQEAADRAEAELREGVPGSPWPVFDLIILGMGPDGHTASLFPGAPELEEARRAMVPVHRPEMPQPWRVSMTLPVLNSAKRILMVVGDADKAAMVKRGVARDRSIPAGRVAPKNGEMTWILTEDAAADL